MRKVHYRVVLDVFVHEDEGADGEESLRCGDFWPNIDGDGDDIDVMDIRVETVEVTDSR